MDITEEVLLLKLEGFGGRAIAQRLEVPYGKVRGILEKNRGSWAAATEKVDPRDFGASPLKLVVWDIETTDLRSDIGRLVIVSFLDAHTGKLETRDYTEGGERALAVWAKEKVAEADMLIGHNTKAFDRNFVNGVLARHGETPLPDRQHLDTYLIARYGLKGVLQSNRLSNLADFFNVGQDKYQPSKHDWRDVLVEPESLAEIRKRCEEDVMLNLKVWHALKPYWHKWKGD